MRRLFPILSLCFIIFGTVNALYFHIAETEKKCFIEEIPDETMVMGRYKVQLYDPNTKAYGDYPTIGMHVEVKDPEEKVCSYLLVHFPLPEYLTKLPHINR